MAELTKATSDAKPSPFRPRQLRSSIQQQLHFSAHLKIQSSGTECNQTITYMNVEPRITEIAKLCHSETCGL